MRNFGFLLFLFLAVTSAKAQVTAELTMDQEQFLVGEEIKVAARVKNFSGRTLELGAEENWLTFTVEAIEGLVVSKIEEIPVKGEFELESSAMATKRVNLEPYFGLGKPGRYRVIAQVRIPGWEKELTTKPKLFDVTAGGKLWEQEIGVPSATAESAPEVRKYTLQQANFLKQLRLYLRVTDRAGAKLFRLIQVGPLVSFSRPEVQVDKWSNAHVLHQTGPRNFNYLIATPDGDTLARQTYQYTETRPILKFDHDGRIFVRGGIRLMASTDIPPSSTNQLTDVKKNP